jgi:hypothetical protein
VQHRVERGEQTDHAPSSSPPRPAAQTRKRRDAKREADEAKSPVSGRVLDKLDRVDAKTRVEAGPEEVQGRRKT